MGDRVVDPACARCRWQTCESRCGHRWRVSSPPTAIDSRRAISRPGAVARPTRPGARPSLALVAAVVLAHGLLLRPAPPAHPGRVAPPPARARALALRVVDRPIAAAETRTATPPALPRCSNRRPDGCAACAQKDHHRRSTAPQRTVVAPRPAPPRDPRRALARGGFSCAATASRRRDRRPPCHQRRLRPPRQSPLRRQVPGPACARLPRQQQRAAASRSTPARNSSGAHGAPATPPSGRCACRWSARTSAARAR